MPVKTFLIFLTMICIVSSILAQSDYIHSKEGRPVLDRKRMLLSCLTSLHKDRTDPTAVAVCDCQLNQIDRYFTNKQFRQHTDGRTIDLPGMIKEDSFMNQQMELCYKSSGKTALLAAEGFQDEYVSSCMKNIQKNTQKKLDSTRLLKFCRCQLDLVRSKKLDDEQLKALKDPNSLLFYNMIYNCGDPFSLTNQDQKNWSKNSEIDVEGPPMDTVKILAIDGMTYIRLKIGGTPRIWLFDTGSTDLLITEEIEQELKKDQILNGSNYLGVGEFEMANGQIDSCRRYTIDNVKIGKYSIKNITVAVTDKGKKIIVGKSLLNKFSNWMLNNKNEELILER